ncbi:MAG: DUF1643 domain-containing protein [Pseudomonadota bacterium]
MITRSHVDGNLHSTALYSDCEAYRYALTRRWDAAGRRLLYILLNPSQATELKNDPTVERCHRRAEAMGFGAYRVCNIFAWRATLPKDLKAANDPIGPHNMAHLIESADWADQVVCGWGVHGAHLDQGPKVAERLRANGTDLYHFGTSKAGHPRHPLYVPYATGPTLWV